MTRPTLPRCYTAIPTPSRGEPIFVDGIPGLILEVVGQIDGVWEVETNRGQRCAVLRPFRTLDTSLCWLGQAHGTVDRTAA